MSILLQLIVSFFDSRATGFYVLLSIRGRQARSPFFFVLLRLFFVHATDFRTRNLSLVF
jgi:hypothetical protein